MWLITKKVYVKDDSSKTGMRGYRYISTQYKRFKFRYFANLYIKFFLYWDADEEDGMSGRPDSDYKIIVTIQYEKL